MNKTTYLFTSIRDSNNSRECVKILEIPEGRGGGHFGGLFWKIQRGGGYTANSFCGGCMDMFWNNTIAGTSSQ